jgi:uncharacterized protein YggU (UPF0235/DUF167 family)
VTDGAAVKQPALSTFGASRGTLGAVRITIRVRPGASHPGVGGQHDGALVVRVSARAVGGQATAAALAAVAAAFGVRPREVTLITGAASRTKIVEVPGGDPAVLARLLAQDSAPGPGAGRG